MPWVTDHIFAAGGDFVTAQWGEFQNQTGVRAVITVALDKPGVFLEPLPWAALWLPVSAEAQYTLDQLMLGAHFIDAALAGGRKVLLHSPPGAHRVRPLVAAHLVINGKSVKRVVTEMEQKPWLPPYRGDVTLLEQIAGSQAET